MEYASSIHLQVQRGDDRLPLFRLAPDVVGKVLRRAELRQRGLYRVALKRGIGGALLRTFCPERA
jgi:hypothetical protein